jgi:predicted dinucleotide-binding enzyme
MSSRRELAKGEAVEVTGSVLDADGATSLTAREARKGATQLRLRDERGLPAWAAILARAVDAPSRSRMVVTWSGSDLPEPVGDVPSARDISRAPARARGAYFESARSDRRTRMATIGLIGAGHIGSQVARLAVANGYDVVISNSRGPQTLSALVEELGARARAGTALDAAQAGDLVVVTIPLKNYGQVPVEPLAGKVVIDTNNYYPERDGHIPELDDESTTTSELLQAHLPKSRVVKAFNHIYAAELTTHGQPAGSRNRRALVIAGDDPQAKKTVAQLLDQFGFDTVDAGPLKEGWRIQRDTPGYGPRRTAEELRRDLAAARRYADR